VSVGNAGLRSAGRFGLRNVISLALVAVVLFVGLVVGTYASSHSFNGAGATVNEEAQPQAWIPKSPVRFFWFRDWGGLMRKAVYPSWNGTYA
jgi:hypothetical protein